MEPIDAIRGDSRNIRVAFQQNDGTAYNITGGKVFFTVSRVGAPVNDSAAVISKLVTTHTDATAGETTISLTPSDTNITPGVYWYDVQLVDTLGNVLSKGKQRFVVISDITRRIS